MNCYRPAIRDKLVIRQVDDGFLVYDPVSDRTTRLNWSAAVVLDRCNGERTVGQIIAEVARAIPAPVGEVVTDIEDAIRRLAAKGLLATQCSIVGADNGRRRNSDLRGADRRGVVVTAPGLDPLRVPQLGDIGVGPPDTVTTVQVLGPYNSGTCLMFNYPHRLTAARTRYHLLWWKHSLPPVYAWADGCLWDKADGGPPEGLLRTTLVVCMVRSPYFWLLSTARHNYEIRFEDGAETFSERLRSPVHFGRRRYDNLTAVWNEYYRAYRTHLEPTGAAFVRLEDLVEAPMTIVNALGHHLEILSSPRLEAEVARIAATPAKVHQGPCVAGEQARQRYRVDNVPRLISADDLALINEQIDHALLAAFGYPIVYPTPSAP